VCNLNTPYNDRIINLRNFMSDVFLCCDRFVWFAEVDKLGVVARKLGCESEWLL
jgi:hypothetical protein